MENEEEDKEITIISVISEKSEKSGQKDGKPWTRYVFKFGDRTMSTFDNRLKDFKVGDVVKVMYKKSGLFRNILDMKLAEQSEIVTADKIKNEPNQKVWIEKDQRIVRENCNERAIELLDVIWNHSPEKIEQVLKANGDDLMKVIDYFANFFENRVWRNMYPEEVM